MRKSKFTESQIIATLKQVEGGRQRPGRMPLKIHGYADQGLPFEEIESSELAEITLDANASELQKMAAFLIAAADRMERLGAGYGHEHLADKQPGFDESPHFVVFSSATSPQIRWGLR